jgi:peroxiredoxin
MHMCRMIILPSVILAICLLSATSCATNDNSTLNHISEGTLSPGTGKLEISDVAVTNIQVNSLVVTWKTNLPSTSGLSALPVNGGNSIGTWPDNRLVSEHKVTLKNLEPATAYRLTIKSKDTSGNQATLETDSATHDPRTSMELAAGDAAPDFILKSMTGDSYRLSDFRGKWVMVVFWMTRCDSCKQEIQYLNTFQGNFRSNDFRLLTINVGENDAYTTNLIAGQNLLYPVLLDEDKAVSENYTVVHFPTATLIDPNGNILKIKEKTFNSESEIHDFVRSVTQSE